MAILKPDEFYKVFEDANDFETKEFPWEMYSRLPKWTKTEIDNGNATITAEATYEQIRTGDAQVPIVIYAKGHKLTVRSNPELVTNAPKRTGNKTKYQEGTLVAVSKKFRDFGGESHRNGFFETGPETWQYEQTEFTGDMTKHPEFSHLLN